MSIFVEISIQLESLDRKYEPYASDSMPLQARQISVPLLCLVLAKCTFHLITEWCIVSSISLILY